MKTTEPQGLLTSDALTKHLQSVYKINVPGNPLAYQSYGTLLTKNSAPEGVPAYSASISSRGISSSTMSKGKHIKRGNPATAETDLAAGKFIPVPVGGGKEIHIGHFAASPKLYVRWHDPSCRNGYTQMTTGETEYRAAERKGLLLFKEHAGVKKEPTLRELAAAYRKGKTKRLAEIDRLLGHLLPVFGDRPASAFYGKAGLEAIRDWHNSRRTWEDGEGAETLYRYAREIRYVLKHHGVLDLPHLPKRPKGRRAPLRENDVAIISRHLRQRCRQFGAGNFKGHGRRMLWAYYRLASLFSGRTGTQALSIEIDGIEAVDLGGKKLRFRVRGKTGPAFVYAPHRARHLIALIKRLRPKTTSKALFIKHDGTPHVEMHHVFRRALRELEEIRGEPEKWTRRFLGKGGYGAVSLYSLRHGKITDLERRGVARVNIAKTFDTSPVQIAAHYSHVAHEEAVSAVPL
jgi:hypothetical protein